MRKLVTCPDWGHLAAIETFEDERDRVAFVAHCSLWKDDDILENCRELCADRLNERRAARSRSRGEKR